LGMRRTQNRSAHLLHDAREPMRQDRHRHWVAHGLQIYAIASPRSTSAGQPRRARPRAPSFVFVAIVYPLVPRLRGTPWTRGSLDGVNLTALGLMLASLTREERRA